MRRTSVFVTIAFLAGLGVGFFAGRTGREISLSRDTHAVDLAGIDKLHKEDIRVTLLQDPKGLVDIWTEDAVRFIPGSPPDVGKLAIEATNKRGRGPTSQFERKGIRCAEAADRRLVEVRGAHC
jgi:hypothetical protein